MALGTTNISTTLVSQTIGLNSGDVGTLCTYPSVGGTGNSAFRIVENGFTITDGKLISGALPKWNIYSNSSPGEWKLPVVPDGTIYFTLKRSPYDSSRYSFPLGGFRSYNHSAVIPSVDIDNLTGQYDFPRRFYDIDVDFMFHAKLGEYNWTNLAANASDIKLMVYNPSNTLIFTTPNVAIYPFYPNGDTTFGYGFTIDLQYVGIYNYKVRVALCNSLGTILGFMPFDGNIPIEVFEADVRELSMNIPGNPEILYSGVYTQDHSFYQFAYPTSDATGTWNLTSIDYLTYNKSDDSLVNTLTILPVNFTIYDTPQQQIDLYEGVEITLTCDDSRVILTKNQYLRVKLNYT